MFILLYLHLFTQLDHHLVSASLYFVWMTMVLIWSNMQHFICAYFLATSNSRRDIFEFPDKSIFLCLLVINAQIVVIWTLNSKFNICVQLIYQIFLQPVPVWNYHFILERSEVFLHHGFIKRFQKDA